MVKIYKPQLALQQFISRIMLVRYQLDPTKPRTTNPLPPAPEHCLYFYLYDKVVRHIPAKKSTDELSHCIVVGPKLCKVDLTFGYNHLIIIVGFNPGGLHRLLGIPMHEIIDQSIDGSLLLGNEVKDIIDQLYQAANPNHIIEIIESFLLEKSKKLKYILPIDAVLVNLLQNENPTTVDQLAKEACVSIRQLERQMKERIGLPPKVFFRLVRFSKAWMMRENNPDISWLKIAHHCDYTDQMHMIRDLKDFIGVTPGILQTDLEKSPLRRQTAPF